MAVFMALFGILLIGLCLCTALLRWNEVRYRKKGLPPGTMGWPVFGETTEFLKQGPNFMKNQRARCDSSFLSSLSDGSLSGFFTLFLLFLLPGSPVSCLPLSKWFSWLILFLLKTTDGFFGAPYYSFIGGGLAKPLFQNSQSTN